jgi:hypothetical protein
VEVTSHLTRVDVGRHGGLRFLAGRHGRVLGVCQT